MMMHSPGPWRRKYRNSIIAFVRGNQHTVAQRVNREADAYLIAAAPELLHLAQLVEAGNTEYTDLEAMARELLRRIDGPTEQ